VVAFLAGLVVLLLLLLMGAWATIEAKTGRIAELEALRAPAMPKSTAWHVVVRERPTMPELWPRGDERDDVPTKVCPLP
jgi:hypothetical protein